MARAPWPLQHDRPAIEVTLTLALGGTQVSRWLLADSGAGNAKAAFEILLDETDCLLCGGKPTQIISLTGALAGPFPLYILRIRIPLLGFDDNVAAIGVPNLPMSLDGIACFRFLNRFTYGNFGNAGEFGLET